MCVSVCVCVAGMIPGIFERKFEVDSLANFLYLSSSFWTATGGDVSAFDVQWRAAVDSVLGVFESLQSGWDTMTANPPYQFQRTTSQPSDSLEDGLGWPAKRTGMLRTFFRASDDAHTFPFNVPENAFAAVALERLVPLLTQLGATASAQRAGTLAADIRTAIAAHGTLTLSTTGTKVYAYEVDGYANQLFMDDANMPSLLSLPVFGFVNSSDTLYRATRAALFSASNPWYENGTVGSGIGSPHTGWAMVWPMSFVTRAVTAISTAEIQESLASVVAASACSGLMHESVYINDPTSYTRPWFAWANSWLGEAILRIADSNPSVIFNS